jgi:hypothetical protein
MLTDINYKLYTATAGGGKTTGERHIFTPFSAIFSFLFG